MLWKNFDTGLFELLNEGIAAAPAESGMSRVDDNVMIRVMLNEDIAKQGPEGVSYAYELCVDEDQPPEDDEEDENAECWPDGPEPGMRRACVWWTGSREGEMLPYSGSFKVAIASLITKFYEALLLYDPANITATAHDDGIWTDI